MCRNADLVLQRSATTKAARTRWGCLCRPGTYAIVDVHQERLERAPAGGAGAGSSWSQALARAVGQGSVCRRLGSGAGRLGVARSHSIVYSLFESACYQKPDERGAISSTGDRLPPGHASVPSIATKESRKNVTWLRVSAGPLSSRAMNWVVSVSFTSKLAIGSPNEEKEIRLVQNEQKVSSRGCSFV